MIDERREVRDAEDSHEDYKNIYSLMTDSYDSIFTQSCPNPNALESRSIPL